MIIEIDRERLHQTILGRLTNPIDKALYYTFFDQRSSDLILRIKVTIAAIFLIIATSCIPFLSLNMLFAIVPWPSGLAALTLAISYIWRTIIIASHISPLRGRVQTLIEINRLTEFLGTALETDKDKATIIRDTIIDKFYKKWRYIRLQQWIRISSSLLQLQGKIEEAEKDYNRFSPVIFEEANFIVLYLEKREFAKAIQLLKQLIAFFGSTPERDNMLRELENKNFQPHMMGPSSDLSITLSRLEKLDDSGIPTKNTQAFIRAFLQMREPLPTNSDEKRHGMSKEEQTAFEELVKSTLEQQNYKVFLNPHTEVIPETRYSRAVTLGDLVKCESTSRFTIIEPYIQTLIYKGHFPAAYALIQAVSQRGLYYSVRYCLQVSILAHKVQRAERAYKERLPALALWNLHAYAADYGQEVPDIIPSCGNLEERQFPIHGGT